MTGKVKKHPPEISYIVSAYNRPVMLPVALWSIKGQTHQDFECIVADNATDDGVAKQQEKVVLSLEDVRFRYIRTAKKTKISECYWAAEWAAGLARGKWLCFPCDDCYYVPDFARRLLIEAVRTQADIVLSDQVLMGPESAGGSGEYEVWRPEPYKLIKSMFIVRADKFPGFSAKPLKAVSAAADQVLGYDLVQSGARFARSRGLLVVHN